MLHMVLYAAAAASSSAAIHRSHLPIGELFHKLQALRDVLVVWSLCTSVEFLGVLVVPVILSHIVQQIFEVSLSICLHYSGAGHHSGCPLAVLLGHCAALFGIAVQVKRSVSVELHKVIGTRVGREKLT
jgi:hypothetical protein